MSGQNPSNAQASATPSDYDFTGTSGSDWFTGTNWATSISPGATISAGETVTIGTGHAMVGGSGNTASAVTNDGLINVTGSATTLTDAFTMAGSGIVALDSGASFIFDNTKGSETGISVDFGANGTGTAPNIFDIDSNYGGFGGTINNFGANDQIVLGSNVLPPPASASAVALTYNAAASQLIVTDTFHGVGYSQKLHLTGTFDTSPGNTIAASVGSAGIILSVPCFAEATRILTTRGAVAVEHLAVGDEVITAREGAPASRPIIWIGHRSIALDKHPAREKVQPVRILAGAFAPGLPERDLVVSPDHALFMNNVLIEAKHLVNGVTILSDDRPAKVVYYHVELDAHDVLHAEGLAAESYAEDGNRALFANGWLTALHPDFAGLRPAIRCAPVRADGEDVRAARDALRDRALALGFIQTESLCVTAETGTGPAERLTSSGDVLRFPISAGTERVTLYTTYGVPAETGIDPDDRRVLGIKIGSITLIASDSSIAVDLDTVVGLYPPDEGAGRWSGAVVQIPLFALDQDAVLEIALIGVAARWEHPAIQQRAAG